MNTTMLGLLAESPIHSGSGRSMGVVDLPVTREGATDYPVLTGSSLKGALRDKARMKELEEPNIDRTFGKPDRAGDLLVADARLLLLPVRSLTGYYRWVTCGHLIERFRRDLARAGLPASPEAPPIERGHVLTVGDGMLFLEEREFEIAPMPPEGTFEKNQGRHRAFASAQGNADPSRHAARHSQRRGLRVVRALRLGHPGAQRAMRRDQEKHESVV